MNNNVEAKYPKYPNYLYYFSFYFFIHKRDYFYSWSKPPLRT